MYIDGWKIQTYKVFEKSKIVSLNLFAELCVDDKVALEILTHPQVTSYNKLLSLPISKGTVDEISYLYVFFL